MAEKKNEIWIGKNEIGYHIRLTDNYSKNCNTNKIESCTYNCLGGLDNGDSLFVLDRLLDFVELYSKGIKLRFEKNPITTIPEREKSAIEKLVNKLERLAVENRNLKHSLKKYQIK
ncbi:hypothetical protein HYT91_03535 [Candidatus Pacearchaeota archaeon]|nr:hypothetical protein [Candidatus Pacearchaeota archaeon]